MTGPRGDRRADAVRPRPGKAALIVIDMQRDFLLPGGFGESLGNDVDQLPRVIPPLAALIAAARDAGIMVIHTRESQEQRRGGHERIYEQTPRDLQEPVARSWAEAWEWCIARGLVTADLQKGADRWAISRLGRRVGAEQEPLAHLRSLALLEGDLHHRIADTVRSLFAQGHAELAAFEAMKQVEIRVRELSGAAESDIGVGLMRQAFKPLSTSATGRSARLPTLRKRRGSRKQRRRCSRGRSGSSRTQQVIARSSTRTRPRLPRRCCSPISSCASSTGVQRLLGRAHSPFPCVESSWCSVPPSGPRPGALF